VSGIENIFIENQQQQEQQQLFSPLDFPKSPIIVVNTKLSSNKNVQINSFHKNIFADIFSTFQLTLFCINTYIYRLSRKSCQNGY
jgi:hypothetical protein